MLRHGGRGGRALQLGVAEAEGGSVGELREIAEPFHDNTDDLTRARVGSVRAKEPVEPSMSLWRSESVTPVSGGGQGHDAVSQIREVPQPRAWGGEVPVDDPDDVVMLEDEVRYGR